MPVQKSACELCGKREDRLGYSFVEGVRLQVCSNCARFGKFAGEVPVSNPKDDKKKSTMVSHNVVHADEEVEEEFVIPDFASKIRKKREELGLSQKEFAMKLNERESFVSGLENGTVVLSLDTAKKLEKVLHLTLIMKEKPMHIAQKSFGSSGAMTIGDLLNKK
jgi:putative transcription factor